MSQKKFLLKNTGTLKGKIVAISGATGGLGTELCKLLAQNGAEIIVVDRNPKKQSALIQSLCAAFPNLKISGIIADMEDMSSVKAAANSLLQRPLDVLILNAGAYNIPRHKTDLGWDNVFQINFVSPYYLACTLLPHVKKRGGRIVAVGSIAQGYSKTNVNDVDFSTCKKAGKVYGNAKRYLLYSLFALVESGEPVVVAHPGVSATGITAHYPKVINAIIKYPMKWVFMSPQKACLCIYYAIFCLPKPYFWIGPRVFGVWGLPKVYRPHLASAQERQQIVDVAKKVIKM